MPDVNTHTRCGASDVSDTSIFIADAYTIKSFADGHHGKRVSKNKLLSVTNPFHCMFCCPLAQSGDYFASYFLALTETVEPHNNEELPNYVSMLLSGQTLEFGEELINENELRAFRIVGVYDMRGTDN